MQNQSTRATRGAPKTEATCPHCGAAFLTWAYKLVTGQNVYCSRPCYDEARATGKIGPTVPVVCCVCGLDYLTWPYRIRNGNPVCSRTCRYRQQLAGEKRACETCGAPFYFTAARDRQGQPGRFCSIACRARWSATIRVSNSRSSASNRDWRTAVLLRDGHACRICGRASRGLRVLHAHHIRSWRDHPELRFEVSNGITLCRRCHEELHAGRLRLP